MVLVGYVTYMAKKAAIREKTSGKAIVRRKPEEDRRTIFLRVRLTPDQDVLLKGAAAHAGISISSWAVERLLRAARAEQAERA